MSALSKLSDLPAPAKVVAMIASGGAFAGLLRALGVSGPMLLTIVACMVVIGLLIAGGRWIMKKREGTKATPFMGKLLGAAGGTPQGLADPAKRARLDDLRKKFEEGVEKYRASGKNIYGLPWYLLVGPSGSGKTEAMRHCNVGFPPGLQDHLQGAGGTLNMHWWFTNHAVVLDTAGKMFMEEVKAGESSEWKGFLKLLKDSRPLQPINGMLLCIGVDSLIKDSADEIQDKAGRIARQLDLIQRTLDVRFPVYVVVTKCDLITGFREFFETVTDPQLQHQILGWWNPAPLDEAFNPEKVDQHIDSVKKRLMRRRLALMIDPVHRVDPMARRTDEVDSLYALPESLSRLSSRLRRYLELIFVAGEWSPKPLFLRGIYFTSSMRQGADLDEEVAKILGMNVDALPGGGVSEEKSYFLRDVFMSKVFREKGLVTRATNVTKQQRSRKLALIGTGIGTIALLLGLTVWTLMGFRKEIGDPTKTWKAVSEAMADLNIIETDRTSGKLKYAGDDAIDLQGTETPIAQVFEKTRALAEKPPSAPLIVRPFASVRNLVGQDPAEAVRKAHSALIERNVVGPLVEQARKKLATAKPEEWNDNATGVLTGLLGMEREEMPPAPRTDRKKKSEQPTIAVQTPVDIDKFLGYVLAEDEYKTARSDAETLQNAVGWAFSSSGGRAKWPGTNLGKDPEVAGRGVTVFNAYWTGPALANRLGALDGMRGDLKSFLDAEDKLAATVRTYKSLGKTDRESFTKFGSDWDTQYAALKGSWGKVNDRLSKNFDAKAIENDIKNAEAALLSQAEDSYSAVLGEDTALADAASAALTAGEKSGKVSKDGSKLAAIGSDFLKSWPGELDDLRKKLEGTRDKLKGKDGIPAAAQTLRDYFGSAGEGGKLVSKPDGNTMTQYAVGARYGVYEQGDKALKIGVGTPTWGELASACKKADEDISGLFGQAKAWSTGLNEAAATGTKMSFGSGEAEFLFESAKRDARARAARAITGAGVGSDAEWIKQAVAKLADDKSKTGGAGSISAKFGSSAVLPMSASGVGGVSIDPKFHPDGAKLIFGDLKFLSTLVTPPAGAAGALAILDPGLGEAAKSGNSAAARYGREYFDAWTNGVLSSAEVQGASAWGDFRAGFSSLTGKEDDTAAALRKLAELMQDAINVDGLVVPGGQVKDEDVKKWAAAIGKDLDSQASITRRLKADPELWRSLGATAREAALKLGPVKGSKLLSDYFQGFTCETVTPGVPTGPGLRYIDSMRLHGLKTIAEENDTRRRQLLGQQGEYRRLPLLVDVPADRAPQPGVTQQVVRDFKLYFPTGGAKQEDGSLSDGGITRLACVDDQLDKLFGRRGFENTAPLSAALNNWVPFLMGERSDGGELKVDLFLLPDTLEGLGKKAPSLEAIGIVNAQGVFTANEAALGALGGKLNDVQGGSDLIRGVSVPQQGSDKLKLTFSKSGSEAAPRELGGVWSVVELLAEPDAEPMTPANKKEWRVPVVFSGMHEGKQQRFYKWIGLRFNAEVPDRNTWPTKDKWR